MAAEEISGWRDVLRAYLDAQWEDLRRKHQSDLANCEALCLREFGTDTVCRNYEQMIRRRLDALAPPPRETEFEVIEEGPERVVAQVDKNRGRKMPVVTRFTLQRLDGCWKIMAVSTPCVGCSPIIFLPSSEFPAQHNGRCVFCRGSGKTRDFSRGPLWLFRRLLRSTNPCQFCNGQGTCPRCQKSPEKGWISAFTFEREDAEWMQRFE
jgi:hypothetical protein